MPRKTKEQNEEKNVKKIIKTPTKNSNVLNGKQAGKKSSKKTTKVPSQKGTSTKSNAKKVAASKTTSKKVASQARNTSKSTKKTRTVQAPTNVEYYDLPYKYNQTIVKILYQNPTTMFVYWEISDKDIEKYKEQYGDNFFEVTRPVLIVYNDTLHYHFEIGVNDFANSWYFNINDSNCNYRIELIRKPISYNENIQKDYIYISSSNQLETPNDRILFSTNEPYTVYFKNVKNANQRKIHLPELLQQLNLANKGFGFPIVRNIYDLYKNIYNIEDVGEFSISLANPSSHSLSSKFM